MEEDLSLIREIDQRYLERPFYGSKQMNARLKRPCDAGKPEAADAPNVAADHIRAATVLPETITTSASLSFLTISSGVCFLFAVSSLLFSQDPKILSRLVFGGG